VSRKDENGNPTQELIDVKVSKQNADRRK